MDEVLIGSQLLNQRRDGGPEHPEAGSHQRVHQVKLPEFHLPLKGQDRDDKNDDCAGGVEHHDQASPVLAIDDDPSEREHQQRGNGLQNGEGAQGDFRVGGLQNEPGYGGGVHAAAQHRDQVRAENVTQRRFLQNGTHNSNLTWGTDVSAASY